MTNIIKLKFDGKEITAKAGQTILEAAKSAGIRIPTLCHNDMLSPYGSCRICTVEVEKNGVTRLQASCAYPVEEGITVRTNTDRVLKGRKLMIEFLLARCPDAKVLQDLAKEYGVEKVRFTPKNKDCILCGMCVRVCAERLGIGAIGFSGRGVNRKVSIPFEDEESDVCVGCGACTYVCPTGAIQMEAKTIERFRRIRLGNARLCRYMMMDVVGYKLCPNDYKCAVCEVDQRMEENFGTHLALVVRKSEDKEPLMIKGFIFQPELFYCKGHLWLKKINGKLRVGLDDFVARMIDKVNDFRMPSINSKIKKGEMLLEIQTAKRNIKILSPISAEIHDINPDVNVSPDIISKDPYASWIFIIKSESPDELKTLMAGYEAREWFESELQKLNPSTQKMSDITITDTGEFISVK
ncbi:MAG: 2Fe-2S iron-sulfur cluster-binding protein [Elusimicrobiota bacterium]